MKLPHSLLITLVQRKDKVQSHPVRSRCRWVTQRTDNIEEISQMNRCSATTYFSIKTRWH